MAKSAKSGRAPVAAAIDDQRDDSDDMGGTKAWSEMLGAISSASAIVGAEDRAAVLLADS